MNKFAVLAGFNVIHLDKVSEKTISEILDCLGDQGWAVVGGAALLLQFGSDVRVVSPDLDILATPSNLGKVKHRWPDIHPGTFGFTVNYKEAGQELDVDYLAATTAFEKNALRSVDHKKIGNYRLPVVDKPHLMVMKFLASRDKDFEDMKIIYHRMSDAERQKARSLVNHFEPNDTDDYSSTVSLLKLL